MRELVTNFQKKHGQKVLMPAIYEDKDSSDSEGLELADGTKVAKKTAGGTRGDDPGRGRKRGQDNGGDGDDRNKRRKTGGGAGPSGPIVARKEPCKAGTVYPPDQLKAAGPLHLPQEGENHAGPPRVGLDSGAEAENT